MTSPILITVAQMKAELRKALERLEQLDETKPVNIATYNEGDCSTIGFITKFSMTIEPAEDDCLSDINVDFNWSAAF